MKKRTEFFDCFSGKNKRTQNLNQNTPTNQTSNNKKNQNQNYRNPHKQRKNLT